MAGKAKKILAVILALVLTGAAVGYYLWNKPHLDIESATGIKTDAVGLYKAFTTDSVSAKQHFIEKVLEVTGTVSSISKNQQGQTLLMITTGAEGAYINCTMEGQATAVKQGNAVVIKGICNGIGQGDADLGIMGDVYLVRCFLVK